MSLQAMRRDHTIANAAQVPIEAASIALAVKAPRFGQSFGAGAAVLGGMNLAQSFRKGDQLNISRVGSTAQIVGGLTMFAARNPVTLTRGATAVIAGSLLNVIDQYVDPNHHKEAVGLKGAVITGAAGAILAGREVSPIGIGIAAMIGGTMSFLVAACREDDGNRGTSAGMTEFGMRLRLSGH